MNLCGVFGALCMAAIGVMAAKAAAASDPERQHVSSLSLPVSLSSPKAMSRHLQQLRRQGGMDGGGFESRHLQSEITRKCDEVIGVTPKNLLTTLFTAYADIMVPVTVDANNNALLKAGILANAKYDVLATKICASCEQVMEMYAGEDVLGADAPNAFSTYCGPDKFQHDAVVSGLMLQPYDIATDSFVPGIFKAAITGKQANSSSFFVGTERWPSDFAADFLSLASTPEETAALIFNNLGLLLPAFAASTGIIGLFPDTVGYGQDYQGTKAFGIKRAYQLSTATIWLAAKKKVVEKTGGCSALQDSVSLNGYSEGAYAMVAAAAALNDLGVEVVNVYAGGGPYRPELLLQSTVVGFQEGTFNPFFSYALALVVHAFSSTNPDLANTNAGQDLVADDWRETVLGWVDDGIPGFIINTLFPADGPLTVVNDTVLEAVSAAETEELGSICSAEFVEQFPDLYLDKLCEALVVQNELIEILETSPYPVELCQSPDDDVVPFESLPDLTANPMLSFFDVIPVMGGHEDGFVGCMFAAFLPFVSDPRLGGVEPSPMETCPSAFAMECVEDEATEISVPRSTGDERLDCSDLVALEDPESIQFHCLKLKKAARKCPVTCGTCPANNAECLDSSSSGTFKKFDSSVSKTCKWLSEKEMASADRLCSSFASVRSACGKTCGVCS